MTKTATNAILVQIVLNDREYTYAVPSGYHVVKVERSVFAAHWDSGHPDTPAITVTLWDGDKPVVEKRAVDAEHYRVEGVEYKSYYDEPYRSYTATVVVVTEDAEVLAAYKAWQSAIAWIRFVLDVASEAHKINIGDTVEVVKGRKVPKGEYEVTKVGEGQYGPYINLRDLAGKVYTYVAPTNVKIKPNYARQFDGRKKVFSDDERAFLATMYASDFTEKTHWLVLADRLEDLDTVPAWADEESRPDLFAAALRRLIEGYSIVRDTIYDRVRIEFRGPSLWTTGYSY